MRIALATDVEALTQLINAAFRVEKPFFDGDRVNREDRGYVGLLSVDPQRQGTGLGRKLMDAAEIYFRTAGCRGVDLLVISPRTPLPAFYRRLGYVETGTAPFSGEAQSKVPGHYIIMSKELV
jgi:ribosomal protein S18 acetylase RimI-like enzyme